MMADYPHFIPRLQTPRLRDALGTMRVVVLTGARQTGKTTLAQRIGNEEGRRYLTLDRPEILNLAAHDPEALWEGAQRVTLDEVQRRPDLLLHVKRAVDADPRPGRFLLTGSANLLLMRAVSESLAGRAAFLKLPPLTRAERLGHPAGEALRELLTASGSSDAMERIERFAIGKPPSAHRVVFDGGFPGTLDLPDDGAKDMWRDGYVASYLERDLRDLARVADLADFARLVKLAALSSAQVLNMDGLARDAGLAPSTARRYLNLLEVSWLIHKLPAFTPGRGQRIIKSPKLFFLDSGLACHLCGLASAGALAGSPLLGALTETYLLHHLATSCDVLDGAPRIHYWRTTSGHEVDFVVEHGERVLPMELKLSRTVGRSALRGLNAFLETHAVRAPYGVVLYGGEEILPVARNILAVPWWMVTDH